VSSNIYIGNSIVIRHISLGDNAMLHEWLKFPDFSFYRPCLSEICPSAIDLVERAIRVKQLTPPLEIEVIIEHFATRNPIGIMALSNIDHVNRKAEFSIGFIRGQGTRCSMEALHFGLEQAFSILNMRKLVFYIAVGNERAKRFMVHNNMIKEGLFKEELLFSSGQTLDIYRYALLASGWKDSKLCKTLQRIVPLTK